MVDKGPHLHNKVSELVVKQFLMSVTMYGKTTTVQKDHVYAAIHIRIVVGGNGLVCTNKEGRDHTAYVFIP